jgi:hypothetical protein
MIDSPDFCIALLYRAATGRTNNRDSGDTKK